MSSENSAHILKINVTNYSRWPKYSDTHQHNSYELYYLISGSVKYNIKNTIYELSDGDIVLIPPGVPHITRPNNSERHKRILFTINATFVESFLSVNPDMTDFFSRHRILKPKDSDSKDFKLLADALLDEYLSNKPHSFTAQSGILSIVLVHLKRIYDKASLPVLDKLKNTSSMLDAPTEIKILHSFINDNFCNEINLAELSNQVHLSPVYISSIFSKYFGTSFKKYLLNLRINKAKELLKNTDQSIETITYGCGFNSCNHFCKTFKSIVGMSPKMYRGSRINTK